MKKIAFFSPSFRYYLKKSGYFGYSVIERLILLVNNGLQITAFGNATGYWNRKSGYWEKFSQNIRVRVSKTFATTTAVFQSFSCSLTKQK
jgi:hypothetical protein